MKLKKWSFLIVTIVTVFALTACGQASGTNGENPEGNKADTTTGENVVAESTEGEAEQEEAAEEKIVITDEQIAAVKESNTAYRKLLKDPMAFGDCWPGRAFGVTDIDGNGITEVIVRTSMNEDDSPGTIVSYVNGKICYGFDSWVSAALYYCPSTGCFVAKEGFEPNATAPSFEWGGTLHIHKFETQNVVDQGYSQTYLDAIEMIKMAQSGQYEEITEEDANTILNTYVPELILLESPYDITEENLNKYLPIEDEAIRALLEN